MEKYSELQDWGYNDEIEKLITENVNGDFDIGRVTAEHKERYIVRTVKGEMEAEITGNMRFSARDREDFPAVGDWVALISYDPEFAVIHSILPRKSVISRQAVGKTGEKQIIAANIDVAFLVQAIDRDFNINRLERYLTICYSSKVMPVIVLTKTDLADPQQLLEITENLKHRIKNIPVLTVNNATTDGYRSLERTMEKGKTYCLLGSSGVGKSTIVNNLSGNSIMKTSPISESTGKGKHITSHRELIVLKNGAILIDNPGMREVGISDTGNTKGSVFDEISELSGNCRFQDCTHTNEKGCAVLEAVHNGTLDRNSYENYLKIEKERAFFETSVIEKKRKEKQFGKILKDYNSRNIKGKNN